MTDMKGHIAMDDLEKEWLQQDLDTCVGTPGLDEEPESILPLLEAKYDFLKQKDI